MSGKLDVSTGGINCWQITTESIEDKIWIVLSNFVVDPITINELFGDRSREFIGIALYLD